MDESWDESCTDKLWGGDETCMDESRGDGLTGDGGKRGGSEMVAHGACRGQPAVAIKTVHKAPPVRMNHHNIVRAPTRHTAGWAGRLGGDGNTHQRQKAASPGAGFHAVSGTSTKA